MVVGQLLMGDAAMNHRLSTSGDSTLVWRGLHRRVSVALPGCLMSEGVLRAGL